MENSSKVRIDVWSDYVCPFCYLELPAIRRLEEQFGDQLKVVWRAFELRPDPKPTLDPNGEYLHTTWERSVYPMAMQRGMTLRLPPVQPRSRKALEAVAFAELNGRFPEMHEALFKAFFEDGRDIGDTSVLCAIGAEIGLDPQALWQALDQHTHTVAVLEDQQLARVLGISGVPIMFIRPAQSSWEEGVQLRGAVPYEAMESAVRQLLDDPLMCS